MSYKKYFAAPARVVLVGNYAPDAQESMLRFARMLAEGLRARGWQAEVLAPGSVLGRLARGGAAGKWLAYLDKYALFPLRLLAALRRRPDAAWVHFADHSNAIYAPLVRRWFPRRAVTATCHDLLAVRYALENLDPAYPSSATGRALQRAVLRGLAACDFIGSVSQTTQRDVERLVVAPARAAGRTPPRAGVISGALARPWRPLPPAEAAERLREWLVEPTRPFLLHVGSSQPRKNRPHVLRLLAALAAEGWDGLGVFAGEALTPDQHEEARTLGVAGRVVEIPGVSDLALEALYGLATAMIFPSRAEGFGWPVIEAQACGCPVLCSDVDPLPEVSGGAAYLLPLRRRARLGAGFSRDRRARLASPR